MQKKFCCTASQKRQDRRTGRHALSEAHLRCSANTLKSSEAVVPVSAEVDCLLCSPRKPDTHTII